jgi:methylated-DNA-[protein]-cysteine S-methyltransferase/AraC family transcriptional regulator of adaptative response/methylated-DNA-[protein]-cysteine methyltransferase
MNLINTDTSSRPKLSTKSADISNDIAYSIGDSALGKILVARSVVGVCAILIGSDGNELTNDLAACFPTSKLISNEPRLRDDVDKVARFIEDRTPGLTCRSTCGAARLSSAGCGTPFAQFHAAPW